MSGLPPPPVAPTRLQQQLLHPPYLQPPPPGTTPPPLQQQQQFMIPPPSMPHQPATSLLGQPPPLSNQQQQMNIQQEGVYVAGTGFVTRTVHQTTRNVVSCGNISAATTLPQSTHYAPPTIVSVPNSMICTSRPG